MDAAVITIPRHLRSRDGARALARGSARPGTKQVVINAFNEEHVSYGATDELVRQLMFVNVNLVVVVSASEEFQSLLTTALDRRATPETTFLLRFENRSPDILLRSA